jgi:hypothetical protein
MGLEVIWFRTLADMRNTGGSRDLGKGTGKAELATGRSSSTKVRPKSPDFEPRDVEVEHEMKSSRTEEKEMSRKRLHSPPESECYYPHHARS